MGSWGERLVRNFSYTVLHLPLLAEQRQYMTIDTYLVVILSGDGKAKPTAEAPAR